MWNHYPAKVFMGDTGSLALGGFVAGMAYVMQMPLFILIVGLIYLVEVISVIIQVPWLYFAFELVVLNLMLAYMICTHERFCRQFADQLEQQ